MTKKIVFDSGPIISLTTNNLLFLLSELKAKKDIEFYITPAVKKELVDRPLDTKKFKFEALQVLACLRNGTLKLFEHENLNKLAMDVLTIANEVYVAEKSSIQIVHFAEIESIIATKLLSADALVIDERTTRVFLEDPKKERNILESKLHTKVTMDPQKLEKFKNSIVDIKIIRSFELVTVAFEQGVLDRFLPESKDPKSMLLESVLWGVKLNGCAVSEEEISEMIKIESTIRR